jgi:hypothetical protein
MVVSFPEASMKSRQYTGLGGFDLAVSYIKNTDAPLSAEEIKIIKSEKVLAEKEVIIENVDVVETVYVENEYRDILV